MPLELTQSKMAISSIKVSQVHKVIEPGVIWKFFMTDIYSSQILNLNHLRFKSYDQKLKFFLTTDKPKTVCPKIPFWGMNL